MGPYTIPLILIHGYPLDRSMWYGVIAALGSGIRAYAPDLRGFGRAPASKGEPRIEAMAEDLLALMQHEKIERAVVAGMSMGGYVALALADIAPEKIAGLALINSQTFDDSDETRASRREMIKKVRAEGSPAAARALLPKLFATANETNVDLQKFVTDGADAAGVEGICWALEAMAQRKDRSHVIADAKFPVLLVHSADDKVIPIQRARQMADLNPEAHSVTIKRGGHGAALESPDEVAQALRKFLSVCCKAHEAKKEPAAKAP